MTRLTESQGLAAPSEFDAAAMALDLRRLALAGDNLVNQLSNWSDFTSWSGGTGEVGTQVIIRHQSADIDGPFVPNVERFIAWQGTLFNNSGLTQPVGGDLILPDQVENRYWWWIGGAFAFGQLSPVGTRFRMRTYVQDRDPATGQLDTYVHRAQQYSINVSFEYLMWDGFIRSGGGRLRHGILQQSTDGASVNMLQFSQMWAVRIVPDRW